MIFETLNDSAARGELLLIDGGMCHWHLRRDGQLTIREIISTRRGAGSQILTRLQVTPGATSLFAKCPQDLASNSWYAHKGFSLEATESTRGGRMLNHWRLRLQRQWRPNVRDMELIFCADGNARPASIALDAGWLYGARLPAAGLPFRPYFADQEWRSPDRAAYMALLEQHRPWLATILDFERHEQRTEVLEWAAEAAQYVEMVIIIPKVRGTIATLPTSISGKPVRLGYSVPTQYAGTTVPLAEFQGWPHGVHLLGGAPEKQMTIAAMLGNVRSADTNYHAKMALSYAEYWTPGGWRKLSADGWALKHDAMYEAFRRSCVNIMDAWQSRVGGTSADFATHLDLPLFAYCPNYA